MNPITVIGAVVATAALSYTHYVVYHAGQHSVQTKWDLDVEVRQQELSKYKDKLLTLERQFPQLQKEVHDARVREDEVKAKLLAAQRTDSHTAVQRLLNTNAELSKRLEAQSDDSAALRDCKTVGSAVRSVLDACVQEYRQLGDDAEFRLGESIAAGRECERTYDGVEQALKRFAAP